MKCFVIAMLSMATPAWAQMAMPTDGELHSAYCVTVLKSEIAWYQKAADELAKAPTSGTSPQAQDWLSSQRDSNQAMLAKLGAAWDRLRAYLSPRWAYLEAAPMMAAISRGSADWQSFMDMNVGCEKCTPLASKDAARDKASACFESCKDASLLSRIGACASPTWLPF
jgi:hypothetical protein